jgi:hypothetical protein
MHRPFIAVALLLAVTACGRTARRGETPTMRRARVALQLERTTIAATDSVLPFTLRVTNPGPTAARVDFTGDPLYPRGPRDKVPVPALWFTIERYDIAGATGSASRPFATRDTVLAVGETMEVPAQHSLREVGVAPGTYRVRAGIGSHASGWVMLTVTQ